MHLDLLRLSTTLDNTIGCLYANGLWQCWTLEDTQRFEKVEGETRILSGTYPIALRTGSPMSQDYADRYGDMHKGMLWLQGVPGFSWIYLHTGNEAKHSNGCVLIGKEVNMNARTIGPSRPAYRELYPPVAAAIESGEGASITIRDMG